MTGIYRKLPPKVLLVILALLATGLALSVVSATRMTVDDALGNIYMQRYSYNPRIIFIIALAIAFCHGKSWHNIPSKLTASIGLALTAWMGTLNYYNNFLYVNWEHVSKPGLALFQETAAELKKAKNGQPYRAIHTAELYENWPIFLDIDCHLHRKKHCYAAEHERMIAIGVLSMHKSWVPVNDR